MSRPGRTLMVATLPADLVDELEARAENRGITVEELVDELLVTTLPMVLAEAAEEHLRRSLDLAYQTHKSGKAGDGTPTLPSIGLAGLISDDHCSPSLT